MLIIVLFPLFKLNNDLSLDLKPYSFDGELQTIEIDWGTIALIVFNGILSLGSIQRRGKSLTIKLIEKWKMNKAEDR